MNQSTPSNKGIWTERTELLSETYSAKTTDPHLYQQQAEISDTKKITLVAKYIPEPPRPHHCSNIIEPKTKKSINDLQMVRLQEFLQPQI